MSQLLTLHQLLRTWFLQMPWSSSQKTKTEMYVIHTRDINISLKYSLDGFTYFIVLWDIVWHQVANIQILWEFFWCMNYAIFFICYIVLDDKHLIFYSVE